MYGKRRMTATRRAYIAGKKAAYRSMAKKRKYRSFKSRRRY